ncbi:hypothetical protein Tco_1003934 [Tanacetum coccineum]|uniref:Reverse transcriptase domain-containing protein n=1 Tax=Tanacetum coccineum TaxID=301880 RepID=A0ABQ5FAV7_9ASTR
MTSIVFAATTPENTPSTYRASTSANPNPMISPAFVEENYEVLESLLRERRRQRRNEDLRIGLEYFSEDYDEEREMEPRPEPNREATPPLWLRSLVVRRQRERIVGFEESSNREGSRGERNAEGSRPSEIETRENENRGVNLPPLLAAHLGRNENGQPLQSSLTSVHGGHQPSTSIGGISLLTLLMIEGKTLKDQENPLRTITEDRKAETSSPLTEDLITDCFPSCLKARERSLLQKRQLEVSTASSHDTNDCRQLRNQIEEAVKSGQLSHLVKGIKKERVKDSENQRVEGKKDKGDVPAEAPILMISQDDSYTNKNALEGFTSEGGEITFPLRGSNYSAPVIIKAKIFGREVSRVHMDSGSSCEVIYKHCFMKLRPSIRASKIDSKDPLIGFSGENLGLEGQQYKRWESWFPPFTGPSNFTPSKELVLYYRHTNPIRQLLEHFKGRLRDLLRANADVFAWTHADMIGIPRTIMVEGKPFNKEHKLSEYSHVKPIKQKRKGLGPDRNTTACKEVDELTKALQKVKH